MRNGMLLGFLQGWWRRSSQGMLSCSPVIIGRAIAQWTAETVQPVHQEGILLVLNTNTTYHIINVHVAIIGHCPGGISRSYDGSIGY